MATINSTSSQDSAGNFYGSIVLHDSAERQINVTLERIDHLGGEVSFFLDARDQLGEGPELRISVEEAQQLNAWLTAQLAK